MRTADHHTLTSATPCAVSAWKKNIKPVPRSDLCREKSKCYAVAWGGSWRELKVLRKCSLKDWLPTYACEFELPTLSFAKYMGDDKVLEPEFRPDWNEAMPILGTCCGDMLLIHPTGR